MCDQIARGPRRSRTVQSSDGLLSLVILESDDTLRLQPSIASSCRTETLLATSGPLCRSSVDFSGIASPLAMYGTSSTTRDVERATLVDTRSREKRDRVWGERVESPSSYRGRRW